MGAVDKINNSAAQGDISSCVYDLYGRDLDRLFEVAIRFDGQFSTAGEVFFFRAPGRTELGGNHTDHQRGCVLAAGISLDAIGAAAKNARNVIRIFSTGFPSDEMNVSDLAPRVSEHSSSLALVRGVAAGFMEKGYRVSGFDAYTSSEVLPGSGLSSSAAFTVLLANMMNVFFAQGKESPVSLAKICRQAENLYYGKPSGLMDQMASSLGGIVAMDFKDPEEPLVKRITCDFGVLGYEVIIVETGADHAGLTDEYASIPREMKDVADVFGKDVLRDVDPEDFLMRIPEVRARVGDRAVLRAMHFFDEQERVKSEIHALESGDMALFLDLVNASGDSSWRYLQNIFLSNNPKKQEAAVVLALCRRLLGTSGACRIHGGGFGGTVLIIVEKERRESLVSRLDSVLGAGCCRTLRLVEAGGMLLF